MELVKGLNGIELNKEYFSFLNDNSIISITNENGNIVFVNEQFCEIYGFSKEELIGQKHSIIRHKSNTKSFYKELWKTIKIKKETWSGIIKNTSKNRLTYYSQTVIKPLIDKEGNVVQYISVSNDITYLMCDKILLKDNIHEFDNPLLIIVTIEDFKTFENFNEKKIIDKVIEKVKNKLIKFLPKKLSLIKIYEIGEGSFGLLRENNYSLIDLQLYIKLFYENLKNFNMKINNIEYDIDFLLSYGYGNKNLVENVCMGIGKIKDINENFIFANEIRNEINKNTHKNITTIKMVRTALKNYKIISYFQPIINNKNGLIEKYESLVRLIDENDEVISPFFFLDTTKKGKYYTQITNVVLENSFNALKLVNTEISINLSIIDVENPQIREKIFNLLKEYKIDAHRIIFELLEDENIKDFSVIKKFIKEIKKTGVQIAIDDFGSGYSNFERLLEFYPDILKIDGSLIKNILNNKLSKNIVETIVLFAKKQHIKTVAEFVENEEIYNLLKEIGIDYSQGFYFGKPEKL